MAKKGSSRKGERRRSSVSAREYVDESCDTPPESEKTESKPSLELKSIGAEIVVLAVAEVGITDEYRGVIAGFQPRAEDLLVKKAEVENNWDSVPHRQKSRRWLWVGAAVVAVLLFAAMTLFNYFSTRENINPQDKLLGFAVESEDFDPQSPLFEFQQDPHKYLTECLVVLQAYAKARDVKTVLPLLRSKPETLEIIQKKWEPWLSPPRLQSENDYSYELGESGGLAFFVIQGTNQDDTPFVVYFTRENGAMRMDWAASTVMGEASLGTLIRNPPNYPFTLRVIISSSPYYLPSLPESEYESYKLTRPGEDEIIWGYVKRDSDAHRKINALLHRDGELLETLAAARVTVNIKKTDDLSAQSRFFITEMLHNDWVMP